MTDTMTDTMTDPRANFATLLTIIASHIVEACKVGGRTNSPESMAATSFAIGRDLVSARPEILADPANFDAEIGAAIHSRMPNC